MSNTRDTAFVPLISAAAATARQNAEVKLTVVPQAANVQPFRPLGQQLAPSAAVPAAHAASCEPRVTVQRDGDRVTGIHVHCSCGKVIELACVY